MMHDVRPVHSVHRRHPVVQAQREILIQQVRRLVGAVDGVERKRGRAHGDVQAFAAADAGADGEGIGAVAVVG